MTVIPCMEEKRVYSNKKENTKQTFVRAGCGALQHGLLHHLLRGDAPQAGRLRHRQICQRWVQCLRRFHRHP